ncbi:uncharacterized protein LOC142350727 [Convolutriloba macropyga]|uniref:uncharacterized protein LOC142350727 n=1 Tax=Convolutriloba macropyga TaxID=536237 RepID=UPI003F522E3C
MRAIIVVSVVAVFYTVVNAGRINYKRDEPHEITHTGQNRPVVVMDQDNQKQPTDREGMKTVHVWANHEQELSPGAAQLSPGAAHFSPGAALFSPGAAHFSPGAAHFSPGAAQFSPGAAQLSPGSAR